MITYFCMLYNSKVPEEFKQMCCVSLFSLIWCKCLNCHWIRSCIDDEIRSSFRKWSINYGGCHLKTVDSNPYLHNGYQCLPCVGIGWGVQATYACCTYLTFNSRSALWHSSLGMFFFSTCMSEYRGSLNETI